jgi:hypothetical protein
METSSLQPLIDRRLDWMDQALLGLLPRQDRQEIIAQVEARVKALHSAGTLTEAGLPLPEPFPEVASCRSATAARPVRSKLSSLALVAGLLGIGALLLTFAMPLTYLLATVLEDLLGEAGIILAFGSHVALIALGGSAAVILGLAALVRLSRQSDRLRGRGWAFSALATGCLPMFVGCMLALMTSVSVVSSSSVATVVNSPAAPATVVGPAAMPALPCSAAPGRCQPLEVWSAPSAAPGAVPKMLPPGALPYANPSVQPASLPSVPMYPPVLPSVPSTPLTPPKLTPATAPAESATIPAAPAKPTVPDAQPVAKETDSADEASATKSAD